MSKVDLSTCEVGKEYIVTLRSGTDHIVQLLDVRPGQTYPYKLAVNERGVYSQETYTGYGRYYRYDTPADIVAIEPVQEEDDELTATDNSINADGEPRETLQDLMDRATECIDTLSICIEGYVYKVYSLSRASNYQFRSFTAYTGMGGLIIRKIDGQLYDNQIRTGRITRVSFDNIDYDIYLHNDIAYAEPVIPNTLDNCIADVASDSTNKTTITKQTNDTIKQNNTKETNTMTKAIDLLNTKVAVVNKGRTVIGTLLKVNTAAEVIERHIMDDEGNIESTYTETQFTITSIKVDNETLKGKMEFLELKKVSA